VREHIAPGDLELDWVVAGRGRFQASDERVDGGVGRWRGERDDVWPVVRWFVDPELALVVLDDLRLAAAADPRVGGTSLRASASARIWSAVRALPSRGSRSSR
jgi:hypothetical protein